MLNWGDKFVSEEDHWFKPKTIYIKIDDVKSPQVDRPLAVVKCQSKIKYTFSKVNIITDYCASGHFSDTLVLKEIFDYITRDLPL